MSFLRSIFKETSNLNTMSESQINTYIDNLNTKINDETIATMLSKQSNDSLYEKIEKRNKAMAILQKKMKK